MSEVDRLFVPLNTKPYEQFERGDKDWELRGVNDRFNRDTVYEGRTVELRRGYGTDDSLWGWIGDVRTFDSLEKVADALGYGAIDPDAESREEFLENAREYFEDGDGEPKYDEYIAFTVLP